MHHRHQVWRAAPTNRGILPRYTATMWCGPTSASRPPLPASTKSAAVVGNKENDCVLCPWTMPIYGEEFFPRQFQLRRAAQSPHRLQGAGAHRHESDIPQVKSLVEDVDPRKSMPTRPPSLTGVINGLNKLLKGDDGRTVADPGLMRRAVVSFCLKIGADDVPNSSKHGQRAAPIRKYKQNVPADRRRLSW